MAERARLPALATSCYVAGGGAVLGSAFVHWVSRGPGSGLRGHALVDAVMALGNTLPGMSAARLTILWYVVPALGAASWIACGLAGPRALPARVVAVGALTTSTLVTVAFVHFVGVRRLALGPKAALAGAVACCAASWLPARSSARRGIETANMSARARSSVRGGTHKYSAPSAVPIRPRQEPTQYSSAGDFMYPQLLRLRDAEADE